MTDATGAVLPDTSGAINNAVLINSPAVGALGITFSRSKSQSAALPDLLATTIKTIQIFTDCDRYAQAGAPSAILGNSTVTGSKIYCGRTVSGGKGVNKFVVLGGGTTLADSISNSQTTVRMTDGARIPPGHYFRLDAEAIICTARSANDLSGCSRAQLGSTAAAHSKGAPAFSNGYAPDGRSLSTNTGDLVSYFSMISPSMLSVVFDAVNSRLLDNATETLYGGFYSKSGIGFDVSANAGKWSLGGDPGEYFNGTIYYVLMYTAELTNEELEQNVLAVQRILTARGLDIGARTDGDHTANILVIEGTSIDNGWAGAGMALTDTFEMHVTAQSGVGYGGGINNYTVARDGPLINPKAHRNVMLLGAPTNDLVSVNAETAGQSFATAVELARGEGWTEVYCGTMLSRTGKAFGGVSFDAYHDEYNTWLRANWTGIRCSGIFDAAADDRLGADGAFANPAYFGDGVHPTQAGNAIYAAAAQKAINSGKTKPLPKSTDPNER